MRCASLLRLFQARDTTKALSAALPPSQLRHTAKTSMRSLRLEEQCLRLILLSRLLDFRLSHKLVPCPMVSVRHQEFQASRACIERKSRHKPSPPALASAISLRRLRLGGRNLSAQTQAIIRCITHLVLFPVRG
jgi:hypothetical protein